MKKSVILLSMFLLALNIAASERIDYLRIHLINILGSEERIFDNIKLLHHPNNPEEIAYRGTFKTCMARYCFLPTTKLKYFNDGKNDIEQAVLLKPQSAEIRLLRLLIQSKTPAFLNYNDKIEEDKNFVLSSMKEENMTHELLKMINELMPLIDNQNDN